MNAIMEFVLLFLLGMLLFVGVFYIMQTSGNGIHKYDFAIKSKKVYQDVLLTIQAQQYIGGNITSVVLTPQKMSGKGYRIEIKGDTLKFISTDLSNKESYELPVSLGTSGFTATSEGVVIYKNNEVYELKNKV